MSNGNTETKFASQQIWKKEQEAKSLFMVQKMNEWGLETMINTLSEIDGNDYEWRQDKLGIDQDAWNKIIHSEIQPIMVFAHPEIVQCDTKRFRYYRHIAMISQKSMNNVGLQIKKFEDAIANPDNDDEIYEGCRIINKIMCKLILTMSTITLKKITICLGMGAGTQAAGSWHNKKGRNVERDIWEKIKKYIKMNKLQINEVDECEFVYNTAHYKLASDPDIGVYRNGKLIISVEIKGGIDPAAALERGGAVQKSCARKNASTKICIARSTAITEQFEKLMSENGIKLFSYEGLDSGLDELMRLLGLKHNAS